MNIIDKHHHNQQCNYLFIRLSILTSSKVKYKEMDASNIHPSVLTLTNTWSSLFNRNGDRWQCLNTANVLSIVYWRMKIGCGLLEWNVTTSRRKEPSLCQLNYSSSPVISSTRLGWRMTDAMGFCRLIAMKLFWWPGTWQQRQCWAQWSCR